MRNPSIPLPAVATFLIVLAASLSLAWLTEQRNVMHEKEALRHQGELIATAISRNIERALSAAYPLAAEVKMHGGTPPGFHRLAAQMLPMYRGASAFALSPEGVTQDIAPLEGNEKALGHDLLNDPGRNREALQARESGSMTLAGPFELVQGGVGAAGRLPVFLDKKGERGRFWGFISVVIRFPDVLVGTELAQLNAANHAYALWRSHPDTGIRHVIAAHGELRHETVDARVPVPNGEWTLTLAPAAGWLNAERIALRCGLALLVSLLCGLLARQMVLLRRHQQALRQQVDEGVQQLAVREKFLGNVFETAPIGVTVSDPQGNIVYSNKRSQAILGLPGEEHLKRGIGSPEWRIVRPDGSPMSPEEFASVRALREGVPVEGVEMGIVGDDGIRWISVNAVPSPDPRYGVVVGYADITERVRMKQALDASHRSLIHAQSIAHLGSWTIDIASGHIEWSQETYRMFGIPQGEDVDLERFTGIVHPDDRESLQNAWNAAVAGFQYDIEHRVVVGGDIRWVRERADFARNGEGVAVSAVGTVLDITERRQLEDTLRAQQQRLTAILDGTNVGTWEWNVQTGETVFNERWANIVGYTLAELAPVSIDTWMKLAHPDDMKHSGGLLEAHFAGRTDFYDCEVRMRHRQGHWVWVHDRGRVSSWTADGKPLRMAGTHQDITARKEAEQALVEARDAAEAANRARALLAQAVEQSRASIVITDAAGGIVFVNRCFEETTGYSSEETIGSNPRILNSGQNPQALYAELWSAITSGRTWQGELHNRKKSGEMYWELATISPVRDASGQIVNFVAVKDDITLRKQREAELLQAKEAAEAANLAKSQFLATMSHEIRTPMNGILGMAQLLMMQDVAEEDRQKYVRIIHNSGHALLTLLNDILDLSKVEAGRIELESAAFSPAQMTEEIAALFGELARKKGLALTAESQVPPGLRCWGDPMRLRQALSNLVGNAIKFTSAGQVSVTVAPLPGDRLRFAVADTGIGISEAQRDRLFQPFSQGDASMSRRFGGTGLGLAISRGMIELMGGQIGVDSIAGKGSTFWFEIPLRPAQAGQESRRADRAPATDAARKVPSNGRRILLVEDVQTNRLIIQGYLARRGFAVAIAENGQEALEWLAENGAPDLVLMDCQMPVLDGLAATRELRVREAAQAGGGHVPVIALTADVFSENRSACAAAGMDDFLPKPIDFAQLEQALSRWLGDATADEAAAPAPVTADEPRVPALSDAQCARLAELDDMLSRHMIKARHLAKDIAASFPEPNRPAFEPVITAIGDLDFGAARARLAGFRQAAGGGSPGGEASAPGRQ